MPILVIDSLLLLTNLYVLTMNHIIQILNITLQFSYSFLVFMQETCDVFNMYIFFPDCMIQFLNDLHRAFVCFLIPVQVMILQLLPVYKKLKVVFHLFKKNLIRICDPEFVQEFCKRNAIQQRFTKLIVQISQCPVPDKSNRYREIEHPFIVNTVQPPILFHKIRK